MYFYYDYMCSPDLWWKSGHITLKCISIFAFTFSKMEKLVKFLILHKFYKYIHQLYNKLTNSRPRKYSGAEYTGKKNFMPPKFSYCTNNFEAVFKNFTFKKQFPEAKALFSGKKISFQQYNLITSLINFNIFNTFIYLYIIYY